MKTLPGKLDTHKAHNNKATAYTHIDRAYSQVGFDEYTYVYIYCCRVTCPFRRRPSKYLRPSWCWAQLNSNTCWCVYMFKWILFTIQWYNQYAFNNKKNFDMVFFFNALTNILANRYILETLEILCASSVPFIMDHL